MRVDEISQNADGRWEVVVGEAFVGDRKILLDFMYNAGPTLWGVIIIIPNTFVYGFPDAGSAASMRRKLITKLGVEG